MDSIRTDKGVRHINTFDDFSDLVCEFIGDDAQQYYDKLVGNYIDAVEDSIELQLQYDTLMESYIALEDKLESLTVEE